MLHTLLHDVTCFFGYPSVNVFPSFWMWCIPRHCSSSSSSSLLHHHHRRHHLFRCRAGTARSCTFSRHVQVATVRIVFNRMIFFFAFFNFKTLSDALFLCRCILFFAMSTGLTLRLDAPGLFWPKELFVDQGPMKFYAIVLHPEKSIYYFLYDLSLNAMRATSSSL